MTLGQAKTFDVYRIVIENYVRMDEEEDTHTINFTLANDNKTEGLLIVFLFKLVAKLVGSAITQSPSSEMAATPARISQKDSFSIRALESTPSSLDPGFLTQLALDPEPNLPSQP